MWTHLSKLPDARNFPSGEKATLYTGSVCFVNVCIQAPRSTSHSRTVESKEALQHQKMKVLNVKMKFTLGKYQK